MNKTIKDYRDAFICLTHLFPKHPFPYPLKTSKNFKFLMFFFVFVFVFLEGMGMGMGMGMGANGIKYSRVDQVKFFKGCLPQILLGPLLNNLFQIYVVVIMLISMCAFTQEHNELYKRFEDSDSILPVSKKEIILQNTRT